MSQSSVALVTGATSGIGAECAKAFAAKGYAVVASGRRADKGQAVVDDIIAAGGTATFMQCDVAEPEQIIKLVEQTVATYGRLDVAFNNAGIEGDGFMPTHEQSLDNYQQVFDINVRGVLVSMQAEIPAMLANGGGSIINTSSVAGLIGFQGMSVYTASKHAVLGFTKTAAQEYAQMGIRINAVCPGAVETEMYDRFAADEQVQEMVKAMHPIGRAGTSAERTHRQCGVMAGEPTQPTASRLAKRYQSMVALSAAESQQMHPVVRAERFLWQTLMRVNDVT